ncbi:MAG TPA: SusD/RagB family nutrient-binding outer membrane lipoprotein, partial [Cyclobacteriaceae bacterium]|nr:SusD/RagB family nutrient-binding outer membrane lipoprotein [Cyclobacteriaceae bacterium]
ALGVTLPGDDARTLFQKAMQEQFDKVNSFASKDKDAVKMDAAKRNAYINAQLAKYDGASNKLGVVLKQAWFMNIGNGFEVYNTFRRTKLPAGLQTPMQRPRQFALRIPYAQDELNLNPNTPSVVYDLPANAVFWDVTPFQF